MNAEQNPNRVVAGLQRVPLPTVSGLVRAERVAPPTRRPDMAEVNGRPARKRSVLLQTDLVAVANTAVDYARAAGIYYSLSEMINVALEREIVRLADQINDGVMFGPASRSARGRQGVGDRR